MPDTGTAGVVEQGQQATQQTQQQASQSTVTQPNQAASQTQQAATTQVAATAEPTADQIAQWRTEAATAGQLQQQLQQASESARFHQSNASKFQNALAQVMGQPAQAQQPQDPLAPYSDKIRDLVAENYSEKDARTIVSLVKDMVSPLQQELQQSRAAVTNGFQVDQVMQKLYQSHQSLFTNPQVYDHTRQTALMYIMQPGAQLDPELLLDVAASANYRLGQQQQNGQTPPPMQQQTPPPQPFQGGMFGMRPGYQPQAPAQPQQRVLSAEAQQYERELQSRHPPKKP